MKWLYAFLILTLVILSAKAEDNDTGFSSNILPNAGTTTSSLNNSTLDGVQSGSTGNLTNNSTHKWIYYYLRYAG